MAVARGLAWPACRFMGRQTATAHRHLLRFPVTVIPVILWTHLSMYIKPRLIAKKISFASSSPDFTFSNTELQNRRLLFGSGWCNACTTGILYGFSFISNFVALCTDNTDTPVSCDKRFRDFWAVCSNLLPILSHVSSFRTWRRGLKFLFFTQPVFLNRLASPLIVLGLGTRRPGKFIRNLHVSEHDFLLFIYVLWIYTRSRNENSCLGVSQIAIITITTPTALMYNNNDNQ